MPCAVTNYAVITTWFSVLGYRKIKMMLSSRKTKGFSTSFKLKAVAYVEKSSKQTTPGELEVDAKIICTAVLAQKY